MLILGIEMELLNAADRINGQTVDELAVKGAMFSGAKQMAEFIDQWSPEVMDES